MIGDECKTINNEKQRHSKHSKLPNKKITYSLLGIKQTTRYKLLIPSANERGQQLDTFKLNGMQS